MTKQLVLSFFACALLLASCSSMDAPKPMDKPSTMSAPMMKDGVFMKDGKVMETMGGKTGPLMSDVMLKDGTKIMADGTIIMKDGTKGMLMNGDMYDMDGMKSMADAGM
jgi:hypothetical protein